MNAPPVDLTRITSREILLGYELGMLEAAETVERVMCKVECKSAYWPALAKCAAGFRQKAREARRA